MKKLILLIVLFFSIVYIYNDAREKPEDVIMKLYSGELKSSEEIERFINFNYELEPYNVNYHALGYKGRIDYKNKEIERFLNIDHSKDIKVRKLFTEESLDENFYEISGKVYLKGEENKSVNVNDILRVGKYNDKYFVEDYGPSLVTSGYLHLGKLSRATAYSDDKNIKLGIKIIPYYRGNSIVFSLQIFGFTDEKAILSDLPDCATVTWDGKIAQLQKVLQLDDSDFRSNMSGTKARLNYLASVVFYFDKPISPPDVEKKLHNSEFKIDFIKQDKNGLPVTNESNYTFHFILN